MALTTAQKISLFEILETPYAAYVDQPVDEYHLSAIRHEPTAVSERVQTKVNNRLASLSADEESRLISYINQWDELSTCVASVEGAVGGVNGITYSPFTHMKIIQARVKNIIPIIDYYNEITVNGVSGNAPFILYGGR